MQVTVAGAAACTVASVRAGRPLALLMVPLAAVLPGACGGSFDPPGAHEPEEPPFSARVAGLDPFRFGADRRQEYERRATAGFSHVLYVRSPGGVLASARRTERFRGAIERVADDADVDADMLEALVFLESAGRPDVIAGKDPESAAGLTQILASTGAGLLGMNIDLAESRRLSARIARAEGLFIAIPPERFGVDARPR